MRKKVFNSNSIARDKNTKKLVVSQNEGDSAVFGDGIIMFMSECESASAARREIWAFYGDVARPMISGIAQSSVCVEHLNFACVFDEWLERFIFVNI